jgi:predicted lipoprotein
VNGIEANIASGTYNLNQQVQFSKQGFPAIDYLINGVGNDTETVTYYSNANAKAYLTAVVNQLKTIAQTVTNDWTGNYRNTYINNNGTSVTSSVNKTTNNFVKNLEKDIRSGKLGIPAGLFSNGVVYADKVEGYYKNNVSKQLLNAGIKAEQDFFNGKAFNSNATGASLKSALDAINAVREGNKLSDIINNQFTAVYTANNELNDSFSQQILTDNTKMVTAYNTLQQNVVYIKLDMMQALNITIDYVDGDGD